MTFIFNESIRERKKETQDYINLTRMDFKEARVTFFYFTNNLSLKNEERSIIRKI